MDLPSNRQDFRKDLIDKMVPPLTTPTMEVRDTLDIYIETFTMEQTIEMKKLFFHLEKTLMAEMQHQTDAIFLCKYPQEDLLGCT